MEPKSSWAAGETAASVATLSGLFDKVATVRGDLIDLQNRAASIRDRLEYGGNGNGGSGDMRTEPKPVSAAPIERAHGELSEAANIISSINRLFSVIENRIG